MKKIISIRDRDIYRKRRNAFHICTLEDDSWRTNKQRSCVAKYFTISSKSPRTYDFFRTRNEILMERKRHLESKYFYIIHPLSVFSFYWCAVLSTVYLISLFTIPLSMLVNMLDDNCRFGWLRVFVLAADAFGILEIVRRLFTGVGSHVSRVIELDYRRIRTAYLKRVQCYIDIVTCIPIYAFCETFERRHDVWRTLVMFSFVKGLRVRKVLQIISRNSAVGWFTTPVYKLVVYSVGTLLWIHWTACLLPMLPLYAARMDGVPIPSTSWLVKEKMENDSLSSIYMNSLFWATAMFLCVRHTSEEFERPDEVILLIICYVCGYVGCAIFFVFILQTVLSFSTHSLKYEALTNQLCKYMSYRQLSIKLQEKMLAYYEYKFQSVYYREGKLMSILSDQLRKEINLFRYAHLVKSVNILQHISDAAIQQIVFNLQLELFLPNDAILKAGMQGDCMYFLAAGTVAIYTPMGKEICHLTDGSYFGEIELIRRENKRTSSVIAIELCETYRLDRNDFKTSLANEPETLKYLEKIAAERVHKAAFLEELHKKHILERNMAANYNL